MGADAAINYGITALFDKATYEAIQREGDALVRELAVKIETIKSMVKVKTLGGHKVAVVNITPDLSCAMNDAGNEIGKELDCFVAFVRETDTGVNVSMRGKDCLVYAQLHGGGGHADAAGFTLSKEQAELAGLI